MCNNSQIDVGRNTEQAHGYKFGTFYKQKLRRDDNVVHAEESICPEDCDQNPDAKSVKGEGNVEENSSPVRCLGSVVSSQRAGAQTLYLSNLSYKTFIGNNFNISLNDRSVKKLTLNVYS